MNDYIHIKGARVNNLKNIDLDIPRNKLIVITGLSGSGKSSLAFDTLYAEGQRRYVESLSAYARQFLGRMSKPECDYIKGIPPAIAIEQKVSSRNPRSTVGTSTEIYEYLRLLYARIGRTFSPVSGQEVKKNTTEDVVQCMLSYSKGTRFTVLAPLQVREGRTLQEQLDSDFKQGFSRIEVDGEVVRIEDFMLELASEPSKGEHRTIHLLIDRMSCDDSKDAISRLTDSAETAFYEGNGQCMLRIVPSGILHTFSTRFEADGITFEEPSDNLFAFNSPVGACPVCEGFGRVIGIDEKLVIPNSALSVYDGAVVCWRGEKMGEWKTEFCRRAQKADFPIFEPYYKLTREQKDYLWHGKTGASSPEEEICIDNFFKMLEKDQYKIQNRVMLARYRGKTICPQCHGTRLRPEAGYVKVGGRAISDLVDLPVTELKKFFDTLTLTAHEAEVGKRLLTEINNRIRFLLDVGLGYLTLNRLSNSLSGGESQRINLVTALGSSLVGSMYILDEPSIGLHPRDTDRLISVIKRLRDIGNTVVVVEHDEEIIRAADMLIDMGPLAGVNGGEVVFRGPVDDNLTEEQISASMTLQYITGRRKMPLRAKRPWTYYVGVEGAMEHNLKDINVKFPLGVLTVVSGVSGSGKSSLVGDVLYPAVYRHLNQTGQQPGIFRHLTGNLDRISSIEYVDQNPIGKSSRSNAVTYLKVYDDIRKLMSEQQFAKVNGFTPSYFSFNQDGGRCSECQGEGFVHIGMQFMADVTMVCEACGGKRFKPEILEVRYGGKNIDDILNMSVDEAIAFFGAQKEAAAKSIAKKLQPLVDVGLSYIKLGQSSSTLSGGESQRIKLAYFLSMNDTSDKQSAKKIMFIFDEPTTGLHFFDVEKLLKSFDALLAKGHSVVVVEHNMDVIKAADWVIELGPDAGDFGGEVVFQGTPEDLAAKGRTYTAKYLKKMKC